MIWGAKPELWDFFIKQNLSQDILPVVSNPQATISSNSAMSTLGKTPSIYNAKGNVCGIPGWTQKRSTDDEIAQWRQKSDYGICIQTRRIRAFDIDVEDEVQAQTIVDTIMEMAGVKLPKRYREDSAKCLLAFELLGDYTKQVLKTEHGMVEFLADGQQFVAGGTHPKGKPYRWTGLENGFPALTSSQFDSIMFILESEFAIEPVKVRGQRKRGQISTARYDETLNFLEAKGLIKEYGSAGQAHIECPFKDEHTTEGGISSTSYFPKGTGGYNRGHFICFHSHCERRPDEEFEDALGIRLAGFDDVTASSPKQLIKSFSDFIKSGSVSWRIKKILPEKGIGMIYGQSGSGKSFFAVDLSVCIALGAVWNGYKTKKGDVLYVAAEGAYGLRNRYQALVRNLDIKTDTIGIHFIEKPVNISEFNDVKAVIDELESIPNVKVIIIDTLAQVTPGVDENVSKDMGRVLNHCRELQEETGTLVLLIHHTGKDTNKGARGWSGMTAAMDVMIEIKSNAKNKEAIVVKQKEGESGLKFPFLLQPIAIGFDDDGEAVSSCIVKYVDQEREKPHFKGKIQNAIYDMLSTETR